MERANRFALLVDGEDYYSTLAKAIRRAQRWVALVGWDLDTRTHLVEHDPAERTGPLAQFLRDVVEQNPKLHIWVLSWEFPMLFAHVRDPKLVRGEDPFCHDRIHFKTDGVHPPGASHHQKIVVVDGRLAFSGGFDVAGGRWDTSEHRAHDARRGYPPSHDVQVMVDGDAAAALAEIVRDRWQRATGEILPEPEPGADLWIEDVPPNLTEVDVAISRTDPAIPSREVEKLHLDLIASAREFLYIENQYLTSSFLVEAMSARLQEPDGPEIVLVLPLNNHGWIEDHTVEALRYRQVSALRSADRYGRLRICYPTVYDIGEESIVVHSKIIAVDDRLFRIGSANLTDRSMALDTECDVTIEAADEPQTSSIARLRNRLLGEHLDLTPEAVEERLAADRSLIRLIDSCSGQRRCLRALPDSGGATQILTDELIDPDQPLTPTFVIRTVAASALRNTWFWAAVGITVGAAVGFMVRRSTSSRSRS